MFTKAIVNMSTAIPFKFSRNRFMCFFCCIDFYESSDLLNHTKTEHEDYKLDQFRVRDLTRNFGSNPTLKLDVTNLSCKLCKTELLDINDFIDHLSEKHELNFDKNNCKYVFPFKLSNNHSFYCLQCGEKFQFFGPLLRHVNKFHNQLALSLCKVCGKSFLNQKAVDEHELSHNTGEFNCNKCKETFPTMGKLRTHTEKVHRSFRFRCWKCSEQFPSRYAKKRHLAIVHDVKIFQFPCSECSTFFYEKARLLHHQQKVHAKEKNATCDICGYKGFNQSFLNRHMVSHSTERPFECSYCKKTFQRKKTLAVHTRIHENDKRYVCTECGKAFVQVTSLRVHSKTHHSGNQK